MLQELLGQFVLLAGFAAFAAALIDALKTFGVVKDGQAPTYSLIVNLVGFVAFVVAGAVAPDLDIANLDGLLGAIATALIAILQVVGQMGVSFGTHKVLRGAPLVGKSHSL